jgi:hypothetical protein
MGCQKSPIAAKAFYFFLADQTLFGQDAIQQGCGLPTLELTFIPVSHCY